MGLFDKLKREKNNLTIGAIIGKEYEQQYFDECKYIWKNIEEKYGMDGSCICVCFYNSINN